MGPEPNRHWVLRGFTGSLAIELFEVRETCEKLAFDRFLAGDPDPELLSVFVVMQPDPEEIRSDFGTRYLDFSCHDEAFHRSLTNYLENRFIDDFFQVISTIFHEHYRWKIAISSATLQQSTTTWP